MAWQVLAGQRCDQNLPAEFAQRRSLNDAVHAGVWDAAMAGVAICLIALLTAALVAKLNLRWNGSSRRSVAEAFSRTG